MKKVIVDKTNYYNRLDKFLRNEMKKVKLGSIFKMIRKGKIKVNGHTIKNNNFKLNLGDLVEIDEDFIDKKMERPLKPTMKARPLDYDVLYEDADFFAINKPPKVSMHPGTGEEMVTIIEGAKYNSKDEYEPHLVHRLDKLTSGALLIAKNKVMSRILSKKIKSRETKKYYITLLIGNIDSSGTLKSQVEGKEAVLKYKKIDNFKIDNISLSFVEVELLTGRKHQIRKQFADISHPVAGDNLYGDKEINKMLKRKVGLRRFFLHSFRFYFEMNGKTYDIKAPLYKDLEDVLKRLEDLKDN
ncbi:RluA family pseudouridine synthase [Geotoga petraea]|uniref:Ribosomal large subunit pseudouridine synthase C n=1 Tax=Geotoga petraea TaxID=28234 RepID=A0A4Z0W6Y7_9BACT|nr:RluA family pseudouridine synthase [Geotoga petraea]TGG89135.1 RluA family pseudouridine synthase [Geotoga petraea]